MSGKVPLSAHTVLHRSNDFRIEIDSSDEATVVMNGCRYRVGHRVLGILDACRRPISVKNLLEAMRSSGGDREVRLLTKTICALTSMGILDSNPPSGMSDSMFPFGGYSASYVQIKMLNDIERKSVYLHAIAEEICGSSVVLDLGAGSGIMSIAAAMAGAKKIYAIEPSGMIYLAHENAVKNGVDNRIVFIKDWSECVSLEESPNVLITDLIGNDPFDLEMWEIITDARTRILAESSKIIPDSIELICRQVAIPTDVISQHVITRGSVDEWYSNYGIAFDRMLPGNRSIARGWYEKPLVVSRWETSEQEYHLGTINLARDAAPFEFEMTIPNEKEHFNGIVIYYSARIGNYTFSSSPKNAQRYSHWYTSVWFLSRDVASSEYLRIAYRYVGCGESVVSARSCDAKANYIAKTDAEAGDSVA